MLKLRRVKLRMASHCFFIHRKTLLTVLWLALIILSGAPAMAYGKTITTVFPLDMEQLLASLSDAHQPEQSDGHYPRNIDYRFQRWNVVDDTLTIEQKTLNVDHQPQRIIPHAIGLTEVLWAIAPRERIISVHSSCRNPSYSFLANQLPQSLLTYNSEDAEIVIGLSPDLVLTTYYSSETFKNRLKLSHIPFVEIGYFGDMNSIENQIRFIAELVGAETSAKQLLTTMQQSVATIKSIVKQRLAGRPIRVLYYDHMGFVAGEHTTFDSLCRILEIENVAAQNGIKFSKQVDYETVLKWDPDMIIVPQDSGLDGLLLGQPILATAKAVRNKNIRSIPSVYLMASSQYVVASLNYLGGILLEK